MSTRNLTRQSAQQQNASQLARPPMQNQPPNPPHVQPPPARQEFPPSGTHHEITMFYGAAADDVDAWFLRLGDMAAIQRWDDATKLTQAIAALGLAARREYSSFERTMAPARMT
eukprot:m.294408 g.294408  ORF g.294408 m.294408 type:complete len:114 (+) comp40746_c0_seq3:187-528(+)